MTDHRPTSPHERRAMAEDAQTVLDLPTRVLVVDPNRMLALLNDLDRMAEALRRAGGWLALECRPDAEWAAQGHNLSMGAGERERGAALLANIDALLTEMGYDHA